MLSALIEARGKMFFYILYGTSLHFHLLIRKVIWNNRMCPYTGPSNKANCFGIMPLNNKLVLNRKH